ncbi:DUF5644 domain-containing protein [Helicobacter suis]|uniref:DUF5644 domain-containing protein n=1 Tax=Helicobacter suis TaxID=104628 RepID=UPI0024928950|nr:DUF5644 domain-containing protein [Helicobacter suis]
MSLLKLQIRAFRFSAKEDYNPAYPLYVVEYQLDWTLRDILAHIPDLSYDQTHLGLRINRVVVFENLSINTLINRFGKEWILEPLATKYVLKDLLMDTEGMLKPYQNFFKSASFLTEAEKSELSRYIHINAITPKSDSDYFGDGFFLYTKWLMNRYPHRTPDLLQNLADKHHGAMHFVSLKHYIFPKNDVIDTEIYSLQQQLLNASNPSANNPWAHLGKINYTFSKPKIPDKQARFLIYNAYNSVFNSAPLLQSSRLLLWHLGVDFLELPCCFDGGYWGRLGDLKQFLTANAYNLSLAYKVGAALLLCDEDAYANACYVKTILDRDEKLREEVQQDLAAYDLEYHPDVQITYLNYFLNKQAESLEIKHSFQDFYTSLFQDYHLDQPTDCDALFTKLNLRCNSPLFTKESYAHLLDVDMDSALYESARIRYEAIDLGVDFLLTSSVSQFHMLDTLAKKASKIYQRDHDNTSVLFLPQVILLALGQNDPKALGLDTHQNAFTFL